MTFPSRRLEPVAQRVRARIGKHVILDTTHAQLLFEDERRPWRAVPTDALLAPLAGPAVAEDLDGCWWAIELDGTRHDRAARTWDTPPADCPALASLAVVHHDLADQWLDEELPVYGMPSYPEPLPETASLAGLIGIPDDDPAVQLLIDDAPARRKNVG